MMATLKAIRIEKTKEVFRFEIDFSGNRLGGEEEESLESCPGTPIDKENSAAVVNTSLSFMKAKACLDEDLPDGVELAGDIQDTLDDLPSELQTKYDAALQVGRCFAKMGDDLLKDPVKRNQLVAIIEPFVNPVLEKAGSLLKETLKVILCDKFGVVSEIRIERIASLLMLVWNLFKTAVITYSVVKGFEVLVKILRQVILFLQETHFFDKLREMGGWDRLCQLVVAYKPSQLIPVNYMTVGLLGVVTGGIIVYCYMKWRN